MEINVLIDADLEGCPDAGWLESLAEKVLVAHGIDSRAELSLAIVGQERIHQLNLSYLGQDEPTDVLSFSMLSEPSGGGVTPFVTPPDGIKYLGEVIISCPQAVIQAAEHRHSVQRELATLIIHGVLHILGFDHDEPERERQMRDREAEILSHIEGELF